MRKARLAADAEAKKAALDKMKMDKLVLTKQVSDERTRAMRKMKEVRMQGRWCCGGGRGRVEGGLRGRGGAEGT